MQFPLLFFRFPFLSERCFVSCLAVKILDLVVTIFLFSVRRAFLLRQGALPPLPPQRPFPPRIPSPCSATVLPIAFPPPPHWLQAEPHSLNIAVFDTPAYFCAFPRSLNFYTGWPMSTPSPPVPCVFFPPSKFSTPSCNVTLAFFDRPDSLSS